MFRGFGELKRAVYLVETLNAKQTEFSETVENLQGGFKVCCQILFVILYFFFLFQFWGIYIRTPFKRRLNTSECLR